LPLKRPSVDMYRLWPNMTYSCSTYTMKEHPASRLPQAISVPSSTHRYFAVFSRSCKTARTLRNEKVVRRTSPRRSAFASASRQLGLKRCDHETLERATRRGRPAYASRPVNFRRPHHCSHSDRRMRIPCTGPARAVQGTCCIRARRRKALLRLRG